MMKHLLTLIMLGALVLPSSAASAQSWPAFDRKSGVEKTGTNDAALIVSIEDYAFLPDVPGAARNAADWQQFFRRDLGIRNVLTLSNSQAVKEEILAFARRAAGSVGPGGRVWFVFIGHGAPTKDGSDGVIIGADGQQNVTSIEARGVLQTELIQALEGSQDHTVMLLDACFSGRDRTGGDALAKGVMPVMPVTGAINAGPKVTVLTAARGDEVAGDLPSIKRPAFSYLALGALRGWADSTGDGEVSAQEVANYAGRALLDTPGRSQTPQVWGDTRVTLTRGALEPAPSAATVGATAATGHAPIEHVDHIPDIPIYLSAQLGLGSGVNDVEVGPFGVFTAGYKLNHGTLKRNEWRVGVRLATWAAKATGAPTEGTYLTNATTGGLSVVDDNDGVEGYRASTLLAGPELSYAWRREKPRTVDTVSTVGLFGGAGAKLNECQSWNLDTLESQARCTSRKSQPIFGGGVFGQVQWGPLMAGINAGYTNIGLLAVATIGLTVDP